MSEAPQHHITTMEQLVEVATPQNLKTLLADLGTWLRIHMALRQHAEVIEASRVFIWNDDDQPGLDSIRLKIKKTQDGDSPTGGE